MTERKLWRSSRSASRGKILLPNIVDGPSGGPGAGMGLYLAVSSPSPSSGGRHQHIILGEQANNYNIIITLLQHAAGHSDMQAYTQNILSGE